MKCEIHYINEDKTYSQGAVKAGSLHYGHDNVAFTTERKWLMYFFLNTKAKNECFAFLEQCFANQYSFRLHVVRPEGWDSEWLIESYEVI